MASDVDICNLGLSNIRSASINSFTESSLQAQQCKLKYPYVRDALLAEAPWSFSRKIDALAPVTDTVFNWLYVYQYPADCLYIDRLIVNQLTYSAGAYRPTDPTNMAIDLDRQVPYQVMNVNGNRVIVSNDAQLRISYRSRVVDPNLFSPSFIMTLSWMMAAELAIPIVGGEAGRSLRSDALNMYKAFLNSAVYADKNQKHSTPRESEYVTVRS